MKKIISMSLLCLSFSAPFAEVCPAIDELQHNRLGEWHVFNANSGEPLPPKKVLEYERKVRFFAEAAYYHHAPEGDAQCYYDGEGEHYHLETYLARGGLKPDLSRGGWISRGYDNYACLQDLTACAFYAQ